MFRTVAFVIAVAGAVAAGPSLADPRSNDWNAAPEGTVESMDTSGVNFNSPSEVKAFYKKLRYAAARVCADQRGEADCRKEALSDAVRQVNQPQLSMYHESHTNERTNLLASNEASR